ncbi:hypothetical protein COV05_00900 [Candidatus Uhrbacteria bacterium CG10_big_fil_rev_8_21_14_0_10_48_16]|uniref:Uncharacterized protein n=1 Tax=Candidatus Uhrbacteria bacterium CG10_big_fil_rev_8_21_14_0_10_48_16 TaxID=1975038 RepID=A0A2M8LI98_9BACT|nr:MAG: hypothetical protein COV05_00900 [Candidatus Uhrbacteria bacterium CG10_big_fil_rev_8_21_14_0_10_48_16]
MKYSFVLSIAILALLTSLSSLFFTLNDFPVNEGEIAEDSETFFEREDGTTFVVDDHIAPFVSSWNSFYNLAYSFYYPQGWELNGYPGKTDPQEVRGEQDVSIGPMTIVVSKLEPGQAFSCDQTDCAYYLYGYGESVDSGTATVLDRMAYWELRERGNHIYFNLVFEKYGSVYNISVLHTETVVTFEQA